MSQNMKKKNHCEYGSDGVPDCVIDGCCPEELEVHQTRNGKARDKYHNACYVNNCHHNQDKPKYKTQKRSKK